MAVISRTVANFRLLENTVLSPQRVQVGEAVEPGQQLYLNTTDSKYYLTDNTDADKVVNPVVAANRGSADDYISIIITGDFEPGGTVTQGEVYFCAPTADKGEWLPIGDLVASANMTMVAYGLNTTTLRLKIVEFGITHP